MKTKNVKIKLKNIKAGVVGYASHPVYGIYKVEFLGRPFSNNSYVECKVGYGSSNMRHDIKSLRDLGITSVRTDQRTFFKLKHAQKWEREWAKSDGFQKRQAAYENWCSGDYGLEM